MFEGFSMSAVRALRDFTRVRPGEPKKTRYMIFKVDDEWEISLDATGGSTSTYIDFVEGLPRGECRLAVYDHDFDNKPVGEESPTSRFALYVWYSSAVPWEIRERYYGGSDGTAMGSAEAESRPVNRFLREIQMKLQGRVIIVAGEETPEHETADYPDVSLQAVLEQLRRAYNPTDEERASDERAWERLKQEARDEEQEERIIQGEVNQGGTYF